MRRPVCKHRTHQHNRAWLQPTAQHRACMQVKAVCVGRSRSCKRSPPPSHQISSGERGRALMRALSFLGSRQTCKPSKWQRMGPRLRGSTYTRPACPGMKSPGRVLPRNNKLAMLLVFETAFMLRFQNLLQATCPPLQRGTILWQWRFSGSGELGF